jgi:hypothetical protein
MVTENWLQNESAPQALNGSEMHLICVHLPASVAITFFWALSDVQ